MLNVVLKKSERDQLVKLGYNFVFESESMLSIHDSSGEKICELIYNFDTDDVLIMDGVTYYYFETVEIFCEQEKSLYVSGRFKDSPNPWNTIIHYKDSSETTF